MLSVQRPSVRRCRLIRHRLRRSGAVDRFERPLRHLQHGLGHRDIALAVVEQVVAGFADRLFDHHPAGLVGLELEMEPPVVVNQNRHHPMSVTAIGCGGRWCSGTAGRAARRTDPLIRHLAIDVDRGRVGGGLVVLGFGDPRFGAVGLVDAGEVVLAQEALQLAHGEHGGEFGHVVVCPGGDLGGSRGHLVQGELTTIERGGAFG